MASLTNTLDPPNTPDPPPPKKKKHFSFPPSTPLPQKKPFRLSLPHPHHKKRWDIQRCTWIKGLFQDTIKQGTRVNLPKWLLVSRKLTVVEILSYDARELGWIWLTIRNMVEPSEWTQMNWRKCFDLTFVPCCREYSWIVLSTVRAMLNSENIQSEVCDSRRDPTNQNKFQAKRRLPMHCSIHWAPLSYLRACYIGNQTKLQYLLFYLQNNIKTSGERNSPSFERGTSYGLFSLILEAKMRGLLED